MVERVKKNPKIEIIWDTTISEVKGEDSLKSVTLKNIKTNKEEEKEIDGVFLAIGHVPNTKIFEGLIELDKNGFIKTNEKRETNLPGVYAAGDVQDYVYKQAITAAGTGCQAALESERYYEGL